MRPWQNIITGRLTGSRGRAASILRGITQDRSYELSHIIDTEGFLDIVDRIRWRMAPAYEEKFGLWAFGLCMFRKLHGGGAGDMKVHYDQAEALQRERLQAGIAIPHGLHLITRLA